MLTLDKIIEITDKDWCFKNPENASELITQLAIQNKNLKQYINELEVKHKRLYDEVQEYRSLNLLKAAIDATN